VAEAEQEEGKGENLKAGVSKVHYDYKDGVKVGSVCANHDEHIHVGREMSKSFVRTDVKT
jgi:hypothetical protein